MNIPQKWRDSLLLVVDGGRVSIINTWVKPATDITPEARLGDIFEAGSRDHWIVVRRARALTWTEFDVVPRTGRRSMEHKVTQERRFAEKVYVRGVRGLHPMRRGLRTGMGRVRSWLYSKKRYAEWRSGFRPNIRLYHGLDDPDLSDRAVRKGRVRPSEYHKWNPKWSRMRAGQLRDYLDQEGLLPPAGGGKYPSVYMTTDMKRIERERVAYEGRDPLPTRPWGMGAW